MAGGLDGLMDAVFPADPRLGRRRAWSRQVGIDTPEFAVGDEVIALRPQGRGRTRGTFAELVAVPVARRWPASPPRSSWRAGRRAAARRRLTALPVAGRASARCPRATPSSSTPPPAASAAFGVQIAVARGARVIGTASEAQPRLPALAGCRAGGVRRRRSSTASGPSHPRAWTWSPTSSAGSSRRRLGGARRRRPAGVDRRSGRSIEHGGQLDLGAARTVPSLTAARPPWPTTGKLSPSRWRRPSGWTRWRRRSQLSQAGHVRGKLIIVP